MALALFGHERLRGSPFPPWPQFDADEEDALIRALHQGQWWRAGGHEVREFEKEFADHHGAPAALAVTNGTHALEVSLLAAGIGAGDEVIVPGFTFISTSMAVQRVGAVPVPVDVDRSDYCIDPKCVLEAITSRTKAIIPVHTSGHFADMDALVSICDSHGLLLIQDAAHAHGAIGRGGKRIGDWGTIACFSFQNFKLMTAGEGGIVLFPSVDERESAFLFSNCGRAEGDKQYLHTVSGSNFRMSEFSAAVLRTQLRRLEIQTDRREANAKIVVRGLSALAGITPQARATYVERDPQYMLMFTLDSSIRNGLTRDFLVDALVAEGIPAFRSYKPVFRIPAFWGSQHPKGSAEDWGRRCPNSDFIGQNGIWIHHRALLGSEEDALDIVRAVDKILHSNDY